MSNHQVVETIDLCERAGVTANPFVRSCGLTDAVLRQWRKKPEKISAESLAKLDRGAMAVIAAMTALRAAIHVARVKGDQ